MATHKRQRTVNVSSSSAINNITTDDNYIQSVRKLLEELQQNQSVNKYKILKVQNDLLTMLMKSSLHAHESLAFAKTQMIPNAIALNDSSWLCIVAMRLETLDNNLEQAITLHQRALDIRKKNATDMRNPIDLELLRLSHLHLCRVFGNSNKIKQAEIHGKKSLEVACNQHFGQKNSKEWIESALTLMTHVYSPTNVKGIALCEEISAIASDLLLGNPADRTELNAAFNTFTQVHRFFLGETLDHNHHRNRANIKEADKVASIFLELIEVVCGEESYSMVRALNNIGNGYGSSTYHEAALPYLRRASYLVGKSRNGYGDNTLEPNVLYMLAVNMWFAGEKQEAEMIRNKVKEMCKKKHLDNEIGVGKWCQRSFALEYLDAFS
jgi:tetratricopeptide (TPR) repeat protein